MKTMKNLKTLFIGVALVTFSASAMAVPEITVTDSVAPADDLNIAFGDVAWNTTADETVTVTNDGITDLVIGSVNVINTVAFEFVIPNDNCGGQILPPAASCNFTVRFRPLTCCSPPPKLYTANISIMSNDPDESDVRMDISGTANNDVLDSNGDGITDGDAKALGLNPIAPGGDTDGDGLTDVFEIGGDLANPLDSDDDGLIDALETGADANNARIAALGNINGFRLWSIQTAAGETLSQVSRGTLVNPPPEVSRSNIRTMVYTTTSPVGGSVRVRMKYYSFVPNANYLIVYKVDNANVYTVLPDALWTRVDDSTLDVTLTDGDPQTDLDNIANGLIVDPLALGNATPPGSGGGGGGCTLGTRANYDPTLLAVLILLVVVKCEGQRRN